MPAPYRDAQPPSPTPSIPRVLSALVLHVLYYYVIHVCYYTVLRILHISIPQPPLPYLEPPHRRQRGRQVRPERCLVAVSRHLGSHRHVLRYRPRRKRCAVAAPLGRVQQAALPVASAVAGAAIRLQDREQQACSESHVDAGAWAGQPCVRCIRHMKVAASCRNASPSPNAPLPGQQQSNNLSNALRAAAT